MGETANIVLGMLVLGFGFFATAGYVMMPVHLKTARVSFCLTALFLILIGIELGLMTPWPLGIRIVVGGALAFIAVGGLIYVLNSAPFMKGELTQPDFVILPPDGSNRVLLWDPPDRRDMRIVEWKTGKLPAEDNKPHSAPMFRIKNLGSVVAHGVQVQWELLLDRKRIQEESEKSPLFKKFKVRLAEDNRLYVDGVGVVDPLSDGFIWDYPFIAPEINNTTYVDMPIPASLLLLSEIYFCAALSNPDNPVTETSIPFRLSISWEKPERGEPFQFTAKISARDMGGGRRMQIPDDKDRWRPSPEIWAAISFQTDRVK